MSQPRQTEERRGAGSARDNVTASEPATAEPQGPLKSYGTILEEETQLAVKELRRPTLGLIASGLVAGLGIGTSLLAMAAILTAEGGEPGGPGTAVLMASAYAVGFIIVILGRTDLFTEYTTLAILPVLDGRSSLGRLARFWGLIYLSNLVGAALFAAALASLATRMGVLEPWALGSIAEELVRHPDLVILASAGLAGWLMGFLSWLIAAGRDTISQIFFVWLVAAAIGLGELHHVVVGTAEVLGGAFAGQGVTVADFGRFLLWTTLGNAAGGLIFAVLIRYSTVAGGASTRDSGTEV